MSCSSEVNPNRQLHIRDLPPEMFDYIMNFLTLHDRKSASMVSRLWSQKVFSFSTMANVRLSLCYDGRIPSFSCMMFCIEETTRPYRHLAIDLNPGDADDGSVMDLVTRLAPNIESFFLANNYTDKVLKDFFAIMPNLKQISVYVYNDICDTVMEIIKRYEPQLTYLELYACYNHVPYDQLRPSRLHTLKLWQANCFRDGDLLYQLFKNLPELRTACLNFTATITVLKEICASCPLLSKLGFQTDRLEGKLFCYFEQLQNLRALLISGEIHHSLLEGCKPLGSVTFLSISNNSRAPTKQLSDVFPNLRTLQWTRTLAAQMDKTFAREICCNFKQVRCLIIDTCSLDNIDNFLDPRRMVPQGQAKIFNQLIELTNLEELSMSCRARSDLEGCNDCLFNEFSRACLDDALKKQLASNLKRFHVKNCAWLKREPLMHIVQQFPRLQYLEVSQCNIILSEDITFARNAMPECVIDYAKFNIYSIYR